MEFSFNKLGACQPNQIMNLNHPIDDLMTLNIYGDDDCKYCKEQLQYSYSVDTVCWSCFMSYDEALAATVELDGDFYVRVKVPGQIRKVTETIDFDTDEEAETTDYTTQLDTEFSLTSCSSDNSSSSCMYSPYSNMDGALSLQTSLVELVSCMFGVSIYYFKLAPNTGSKDITFKEYALYDVDSVKQIKMMVKDGVMPSSKPEFSDFGLDWQTDWEVEISKGMFATAFGNNAQPTEGDLIYVPMMKRMWMVNEAYEEKNGNLMWMSTTFTVSLVKYQEKGSVNLGDTQAMVDNFVKNKYEDLFGDEEGLDSGVEAVEAPRYAPNNNYAVFESDATRKYVTSAGIDINLSKMYFKGTMICENVYTFNNTSIDTMIVYQRKYCGENGVISFIISPKTTNFEGELLKCSNIIISIKQIANRCILTLENNEKSQLKLKSGESYFVWLRWSKPLNVIEFCAARYTYPENIPMYKLQPQHFIFDIDNPIKSVSKYNLEMQQPNKGDVILRGFLGSITNIKVFDVYNDNVSEILQMYPNHQHLIINDTARKLIDLNGVSMQ